MYNCALFSLEKNLGPTVRHKVLRQPNITLKNIFCL